MGRPYAPRPHALMRLAVAAAALALAGTACSSPAATVEPAAVTSKGTIGIAMPTKLSQRWISDGENIVKQFEALGYETDLRFADDDVQEQIAQIGDMVDKKERALVVGAIDGSQLKAVLQKAADADIPVISYDRLIRDTPNIDYYATFDNFKVGVQQAGAVVQALEGAGPGPFNVELFAGSADDNNATFFFNGAMSVLQPHIDSGRFVVRSGQTQFADVATQQWSGDVAKARMEGLLAGTYSSARVDAVLSPYDGITRGILDALKSAGYGPGGKPLPVLTGQDAELDSVKLIAGGEQTQTVYKDTRELAKVAVQMTNSLLTGGTPMVNDTEQYDNGVKKVKTFLLQPVNVDATNYERILVDGGYYTAEQVKG
ncbi:putative multiple sugar transport system substrate-binding protein [Kineococcus xinjiangensis]|uniref:Putative multiple sugar transport system substrate-binding protein n=1 Tax=Kineococcus xinjiangensis TaxID=512762 RepID=A0A2S6IFA2_9ACTN|nr:multiple monosaccharide ABC transporter substrate-binding protein [Kineococcus xinjiangensis]PPK92889.1 putative multiple sugar transport system substrate-binding protein [Kineococcus xinjiangensis]